MVSVGSNLRQGESARGLIHWVFQGEKLMKLQLLKSDKKGDTCFIQCVFTWWKCSE